jgi:protein TonB
MPADTGTPVPRYLFAFVGSLAITVAVFVFMQTLIRGSRQQEIEIPVYNRVEIVREQPEEKKPPEPEQRQEPREEPAMEPLEVAAAAPQTAPDLDVPALDMNLGDIQVQSVGDRWQGPVGRVAGGVDLGGGGGEDAQGFIEVVPYDTRRPNVPEVAYRNRVSGWVLVAFRVDAQGSTRDVRVLDANPRGVFEEKVVAAVSDWKYRVNFYGGATGSVVLTQKVEVHWENYPQNMPNVD